MKSLYTHVPIGKTVTLKELMYGVMCAIINGINDTEEGLTLYKVGMKESESKARALIPTYFFHRWNSILNSNDRTGRKLFPEYFDNFENGYFVKANYNYLSS